MIKLTISAQFASESNRNYTVLMSAGLQGHRYFYIKT